MQRIKLSESTAARRRIYFTMVTSANLQTRSTGLTSIVVKISKNGGADATGGGSCTEVGASNMPGVYYYECATADIDTLGTLTLVITKASQEPREIVVEIVAVDQFDAVRFGLTSLPNAAAEAAGGLFTRGTGAGQINQDANGRADVNLVTVGAATQTAGDIIGALNGLGTSGGAAINTDVVTDNSAGGISGVTSGTTKVGTFTGTFANTSALDASYQILTGTATALDVVYQFQIVGGATPVGVTWTGYLSSNNDTATFQAWNHVGAAWETIGTLPGQNGSTDVVKNLILYSRHAGTSVAELGKVYIRITETGGTSPVLNSNQIYVSYAVLTRTVGYTDGAVWLDTVLGSAGTALFVNGTADHPCNTLANALTVATALGVHKIRIVNGSSITLASTLTNYSFVGHNWTLAMGGQDVGGSYFEGATISGTATGSTSVKFFGCVFGNTTLPPMVAASCYLAATLTMASAGDYFLLHCGDGVPGTSSATVSFIASCNLHMQNYSGGMDWANMASTNTVEWGGVGKGTIKSTCSGGSIILSGAIDLIDQASGAVTVTDSARWNEDQNVTNVTGTVGSVTGAVGSVTGNVGGNVVGSIGSVATGGITAGSIAADAIGASELAADAVAEIQSGLATAAALVTAQADLDDIQARLPAALTAGGKIKASTDEWLATAVTADTAGIPNVNIHAIDDSTNIAGEIAGAVWDAVMGSYINPGTTGGTLNNVQASVQNIAVTGAALNTTTGSRTITTGTGSGGVANTTQADGVYDSVDDSAGTVDFYYEFDVSATSGAVGTGLQWTGYVVGVVNTVKVYARNWTGAMWEQIGTIIGIAGTANMVEEWELTNAHTSAGLVRLRFAATGLVSATVKTDRVLLGYAVVPPTVAAIQSGLATSAALATVQADTDDIQTRLPAALDGNGNIKADVRDWLGVAQADPFATGVPAVDIYQWRGTNVPAPTTPGIPLVEISSVALAAAEFIRDTILDYSHDVGLTIRGFFIRNDAVSSGKATGLKGALARFFNRNGDVVVAAVQDTAAGTRAEADVSGSE